MKYSIILSFLFSITVFATTWSEVEVKTDYKLKKEITLKLKNNQTLKLKTEVLTIDEITGLDIVNVTLYEVKIYGCNFPHLESELDIFDFEENGQTTVVGYQLTKGCDLSLFVENVDLNKKSLFKGMN